MTVRSLCPAGAARRDCEFNSIIPEPEPPVCEQLTSLNNIVQHRHVAQILHSAQPQHDAISCMKLAVITYCHVKCLPGAVEGTLIHMSGRAAASEAEQHSCTALEHLLETHFA